MRLIDADAFRKWLCTLFAGHGTHEDDTKEEEEWNASLARIITHLDEAPTVEVYTFEQVQDLVTLNKKLSGEWEYLKEHIADLRDANGYATQYGTCQFILNLMRTIEREGEQK